MTCIGIVHFNICLVKSNLLTLEPFNIFGWDIYFVGINAGAILLLECGPCVVIVNCLG